MRIEELNIDVEDVYEYNDEASEILTAFCEDLEAKGMTRPITDDDPIDPDSENILYLWTDEAVRLIDVEIGRLYKIGEKYFGVTLDMDISSYMYREL